MKEVSLSIAHLSNAVRIVHMKALSIYPNAVIHARLAAGFCANRWAEEFSNHSRWSMGHQPNEFILKFSPGSIVIRFFVSLTLLKFVYRAHVWWHSPQHKGIPIKSRYWRFDTMLDNLEIHHVVVCFPTLFKSRPTLAWNCLDSSSHLLSFIHGSRELMGDLQICHDRRYVITAPVRDAWQVRRPLTSESLAPDK